MAFDITPYIDKKPSEVRKLIREGVIDFPTAGMCRGYAQANLIILPPEYAGDFEEFAKRNPFPCPILEIIRGTPETHDMGEGGNICTDIPKYRIYRDGKWDGKELTDVSDYWKEGYVGFLIGCSFSFEETLMREGIEIRHIAQGRNVPMFKTNIMTEPAGPFCGPMVCSMRPMTPENAKKAYDITVKMPNVHGAPVHMGNAAEVGVADVMKPDYGEAVDFYEGEIPVFWPCGVTPQAAVENAKPPIAITHAPGHMFITDIINSELNDYLASNGAEFAMIKKSEQRNYIINHLSAENAAIYASLPEGVARQLTLDRDPHGNVQVSLIETEKLLGEMVGRRLAAMKEEGKFVGKFATQYHFFGYEGRCAAPSNFDADYCYSLGYTASMLIGEGKTGYMASVRNTTKPASKWIAGGVPVTMMMNMERRHGEMKPVIQKALVRLDGAPFKYFASKRGTWAMNTCYVYPGPIQYFGPTEVCDQPTKTLELEQE